MKNNYPIIMADYDDTLTNPDLQDKLYTDYFSELSSSPEGRLDYMLVNDKNNNITYDDLIKFWRSPSKVYPSLDNTLALARYAPVNKKIVNLINNFNPKQLWIVTGRPYRRDMLDMIKTNLEEHGLKNITSITAVLNISKKIELAKVLNIDLLIEDRIETIKQFQEANLSDIIMVKRPWNKKFKNNMIIEP